MDEYTKAHALLTMWADAFLRWVYWQEKATVSKAAIDRERWAEECGRYHGLYGAIELYIADDVEWEPILKSLHEIKATKKDAGWYAASVLQAAGFETDGEGNLLRRAKVA